jgi:signal transduction histidine kinase
MSNNLEKYMRKLEKTNRNLERDIVEERKQEEIRRELVANISHEFKTPLTVITGTVEGIKDGVYQSDRTTLQSIIDEAARLNRMVFDLLELSRIESHNYEIHLGAFDLWDSVLRINNNMKVVAQKKNIVVHLNGEECPVMGDEAKIEQVISNLYSNAIRYSPNNEAIIINVSTSIEAAHLSIVNTGITIPHAEIDKVWEGFYRVEKSRNRASGGTGLGLLIVKRILDLHHSHYGVKNLTNGVEFYFDLKKYHDREKTKFEQADETLQNIAASMKQITDNFLKK